MQELALMRTFLRGYFKTAVTYGFVRSVTYDYQHTKKYYNEKLEKYELKEMLLVDKITRVVGQSFFASIACAGMIAEDLSRLECAVRGKNSNEYK